MTELLGVWAASVTPLSADGTPNIPVLADHTRWLFDHGCHGVVLFGTTGEGPSFSVTERRATLDGLAAAGIPMDRLLVGTGAAALPDAIELTRHASTLGVAGALLLPPFYFKTVSEDGLFASVKGVVEGLGGDSIRMVLYHFPRMAGVGFSPGLVERLKTAWPEHIAGIKDSSGDADNLTSLCKQVEDLAVFAGSEALLPYALNEGGVGCISATANVTSRLIRAFYDGDNSLGDQMIRTRKGLDALPFVSTMKLLLGRHHDNPEWNRVRPPLMELTARQQHQLEQSLESIGALPNFV
jgi:4-hydroxy-tetrahydrodipicolinate synthase